MVLVKVPEGPFIFGSCAADPLAENNDLKQDSEDLQEFWISQTEITNAQYSRCVKAGKCSEHDIPGLYSPELANRPVVNVYWDGATEYAEWVDGLLPTEKEWEKACRGTDARIYPWGNDPPTGKLLNYNNDRSSAMDVGSFRDGASVYGL